MRERTSRNNQGNRKGEEVTVWRGALCLIYTKVLCLWGEVLKTKLQQEAGDKGSEQPERGIDGPLQRKKVCESGNMSTLTQLIGRGTQNGSSTV